MPTNAHGGTSTAFCLVGHFFFFSFLRTHLIFLIAKGVEPFGAAHDRPPSGGRFFLPHHVIRQQLHLSGNMASGGNVIFLKRIQTTKSRSSMLHTDMHQHAHTRTRISRRSPLNAWTKHRTFLNQLLDLRNIIFTCIKENVFLFLRKLIHSKITVTST